MDHITIYNNNDIIYPDSSNYRCNLCECKSRLYIEIPWYLDYLNKRYDKQIMPFCEFCWRCYSCDSSDNMVLKHLKKYYETYSTYRCYFNTVSKKLNSKNIKIGEINHYDQYFYSSNFIISYYRLTHTTLYKPLKLFIKLVTAKIKYKHVVKEFKEYHPRSVYLHAMVAGWQDE